MPRKQEFDDRLLVRINKVDIEALDKIASEKGDTRSKLVRAMIQRYIKRHTAKPKTK